MNWMQIGSALLLVAMIAMLWPRTKRIMAETRKAEPGEWMGVVVPLLAVVGFVVLLVLMI